MRRCGQMWWNACAYIGAFDGDDGVGVSVQFAKEESCCCWQDLAFASAYMCHRTKMPWGKASFREPIRFFWIWWQNVENIFICIYLYIYVYSETAMMMGTGHRAQYVYASASVFHGDAACALCILLLLAKLTLQSIESYTAHSAGIDPYISIGRNMKP